MCFPRKICRNGDENRRKETKKKKKKNKDSLSTLTPRCPQIPYPLENRRFPIDFPLPISPSPGGPNGRVRNSSSINPSCDHGRSSDEDGIDEEDEAFNRDDDEGKDVEMSDDEDGKEDGESEGEGTSLSKCTRLTAQQLSKYAPFFAENEQGTLQPTYSMLYQKDAETWRTSCKNTQSVMPIHHHLPLEMFAIPTQIRERIAKTTNNMKKKIIEEMDKLERSATNQVIYDFDKAAFDGLPGPEVPFPTSGAKLDTSKDLQFDSRFESGNLRMVVQVAPTHYELFLSPDINQHWDHYQWFFFQVSNMRKSVRYTFEIVNCLKSSSMFSKGMQPVMFSMMEASNGWRRVGENVCNYRNSYVKDDEEELNSEDKPKKVHYYSIRFSVIFEHTGDICYIAYHYPYTYSFLTSSLSLMRKRKLESIHCREDVIGHSLNGNAIKMLTITTPASAAEISARDVIVLSARVHPGEANSSWVMHGVLENLLSRQSNEMHRLRERFVFKIVPMLNPDGVINGSQRCSLAGIDLNRVWDRPNEKLHPEIYPVKAIVQYLCDVTGKKPFVYVDLHGHSGKFHFFLYGSNAAKSWRPDDVTEAHVEEDAYLALPRALEQTCPDKFDASECRFHITEDKESSARVNVWRQFGVATSYTLESTFCGFSKGQNAGFQINTSDLKDIGRDLLHSFLEMH
uniref:Peptidase M14 domain-containing protein n=1 Tax=Caenorhabditis japonica TaxID=281687 RepID=A0A8R1HYC5_CAEJA